MAFHLTTSVLRNRIRAIWRICSTKTHKGLRKMLVEDQKLDAIVNIEIAGIENTDKVLDDLWSLLNHPARQ